MLHKKVKIPLQRKNWHEGKLIFHVRPNLKTFHNAEGLGGIEKTLNPNII